MRLAAVGVALLALAGCGQPAALAVDGGWVRLPAVPGRPAAAYFHIKGGAKDSTLVSVGSPAARAAEMHESMAGGMKGIANVPVPAHGDLDFAPGGRHVMLFDVDPKLTAGKTMPLALRFADGRSLTTSARVVAAGDPAP